jgi:hypothetical protein
MLWSREFVADARITLTEAADVTHCESQCEERKGRPVKSA